MYCFNFLECLRISDISGFNFDDCLHSQKTLIVHHLLNPEAQNKIQQNYIIPTIKMQNHFYINYDCKWLRFDVK